MNKLEDKKWLPFEIGSLFKIEKGNGPKQGETKEGKTLYISATNLNNGVNLFCDAVPKHQGKSLTVNDFGQAFYQEKKFVGTHIQVLTPKFEINRFLGIFFSNAITKVSDKYCFGYAVNYDRLLKQKILLPVDDNNEPDFDFMTDYIRERMDAKRQEYIDYAKRKLVELTTTENGATSDDLAVEGVDREWRDFKISEIFKEYKRGMRQIEENRKKGKTPYYSASDSNNGMTDCISNPKFICEKQCICCSTFGDAYYVKGNFTSSDETTLLFNKNINEYNGLVLARIISNNKTKYGYGRKAFTQKILNDRIMLPIKEKEIDWNYMTAVGKELEKRKYEEYLKFVEAI